MRKALNQVTIKGKIYDHDLAIKTVQNTESANYGKEFINGTLDVATDDDILNIVTVHFTYVPPVYAAKNGKPERPNENFNTLKKIIESGKTVVNGGAEDASLVEVSASVGLNDFYINRDGSEVLVSSKRVEGSFVNLVSNIKASKKDWSSFKVDMLINGTSLVEGDPEKNTSDYLNVKGAIFNFRGNILPVEFRVYNPDGISYFENLEASPNNMTFTKVWGTIKSQNVIVERTEESAFGDAAVTSYTRSVREWIIEGTSNPEAVYEIGDSENGITEEEIQKVIEQRNLDLAEIKRRSDEYRAQQAAATSAPSAATATAAASVGGFNF